MLSWTADPKLQYTALPEYTYSFFPFPILCKNSTLQNKMMVTKNKKF